MKTATTSPRTEGLWRAWRARRDENAFASLVRDEIRYAADYARRLGANAAEADDLVQDALVRLAQEVSDDPTRVGVRAWLCRRVGLGFRMRVRAATRRRRHEGRTPPPRPVADPARRSELRDRVEHALGRLDEKARQAVVLRFLHDLDYREMAHVLGVSEVACRLRVHKALRRLRGTLGGRAATFVAMLGVPPIPTGAGWISGALAAPPIAATATASAAAGTATKIGAAVLAAAAASTAVVVVARPEPVPEPTPIVAEVEPPPRPVTPAPRPRPAPPPPPTPPAPEPEPVRPLSPALGLLVKHLDGERDATKMLWDAKRLARLIGEPGGETLRIEATASETELDLRRLPPTVGRIELGPGTFLVKRGLRRDRVESLEIRGSGMDETRIVTPIRDFAHVSGDQDGLIFRDFTFVGDTTLERRSGDLLDVRGRAAVLIERVRFESWDTWTGFASPLIVVGGRALLVARSCEFVGGVRRRTGGHAFAALGDAMVLFESCLFSELESAWIASTRDTPGGRSLAHFLDCRFENSRLVRSWQTTGVTHDPIRVRGGRILQGLERDPAEKRLHRWGRPRADLFEDATLEPEPVRCTLDELRFVLDRYRPPEGRRVLGVEVLTWRGASEKRFVIHLEVDEEHRERAFVRRDGDRVVAADPTGWWVPRHAAITPPEKCPTLRSLVRALWPRLDGTLPVGGLSYHRTTSDGPVLIVLDRHRGHRLHLQPRRRDR
jgi:RNA polymerase sigma factor (sigma-70 family)